MEYMDQVDAVNPHLDRRVLPTQNASPRHVSAANPELIASGEPSGPAVSGPSPEPEHTSSITAIDSGSKEVDKDKPPGSSSELSHEPGGPAVSGPSPESEHGSSITALDYDSKEVEKYEPPGPPSSEDCEMLLQDLLSSDCDGSDPEDETSSCIVFEKFRDPVRGYTNPGNYCYLIQVLFLLFELGPIRADSKNRTACRAAGNNVCS